MLIKLTKSCITSSGHGPNRKVDHIIQGPIWINPTHIISIDLKGTGSEQCPDVTRIYLSHNHQITVLESPEQITTLISELNQ